MAVRTLMAKSRDRKGLNDKTKGSSSSPVNYFEEGLGIQEIRDQENGFVYESQKNAFPFQGAPVNKHTGPSNQFRSGPTNSSSPVQTQPFYLPPNESVQTQSSEWEKEPKRFESGRDKETIPTRQNSQSFSQSKTQVKTSQSREKPQLTPLYESEIKETQQEQEKSFGPVEVGVFSPHIDFGESQNSYLFPGNVGSMGSSPGMLQGFLSPLKTWKKGVKPEIIVKEVVHKQSPVILKDSDSLRQRQSNTNPSSMSQDLRKSQLEVFKHKYENIMKVLDGQESIEVDSEFSLRRSIFPGASQLWGFGGQSQSSFMRNQSGLGRSYTKGQEVTIDNMIMSIQTRCAKVSENINGYLREKMRLRDQAEQLLVENKTHQAIFKLHEKRLIAQLIDLLMEKKSFYSRTASSLRTMQESLDTMQFLQEYQESFVSSSWVLGSSQSSQQLKELQCSLMRNLDQNEKFFSKAQNETMKAQNIRNSSEILGDSNLIEEMNEIKLSLLCT